MKVGFIFECGRDGADGQVCRYFANRLTPGIVEEELEAWLLTDKRALKAVLSDYKRPRPVGNLPNFGVPERIQRPKTRLTKIFNQELGTYRRYEELRDAIKIARAMPDFNRIKRSYTFRRFVEKATGVVL